MGFLRNDAGDVIPPYGGERFPWIGADLQTVRHFLRRDAPRPEDGETVLIDLDDGDRLLAAFHPARGQHSKGCVIAVHGLAGCMDAQHICWLLPDILAAGYSCLRINMRGAGPARPLARKSYSAVAGGDLVPFIDAAAARDPGAPLFMMAHSLGGTAALNMALDHPQAAARLAGMAVVGTPLDMVATAKRFRAWRNRVYAGYMLRALKDIAGGVPDPDPHQLAAARAARSITAFDDQVTAPMAGYPDSAAYYAAASVKDRMTDIGIPLLVLQGSNDPWVPAAQCLALPVPADPLSGLSVVVTRGGGHVGFHDDRLNWQNRATLAWCDAISARG